MQREQKLKQYLPDAVAFRTIDRFDAQSKVWKVKLAVWTPSGEIIEFEENRDVFPSEHMIAQAMLVA
jgi:hypothetical protein